jgi:hypothetical protein
MKPTITARDLVYRGAYRLSSPMGNAAGLTYCPPRGTWFTVGVRQERFRVLEFQMPDDARFTPTPLDPSTPLDTAPQAILVHDHGTALADVIDPEQNDVFSVMWDEVNECLLVSFGDYYSEPTTNDCVIGVDVSTTPPTVLGPWRFGEHQTEFSQRWGYSQLAPAPRGLERFGIAYVATGKDNNTFQEGSWGPGLLAVTNFDPASLDPWSMIEAKQLMFWPSEKIPVTLDTGKVKSGYLSSYMGREYPHWIIAGNTGNALGGTPEWADVPYGVAELRDGWTVGDDAGYVVAIEEPALQGVIFFGNVSVGAAWYGSPVEFADDHTPDPTSPTGYRSWSGIDHPASDRYITSPVFPADGQNPKGYVFSRQGGGKGNRVELTVHGLWIYAVCDLQMTTLGAYEPREELTALNVDYTAFHILASPLPIPGVTPIAPLLQYEDRLNASPTIEVAYLPNVTGVHYRRGDDTRPGRIYVRMSSNLGVEVDAVNVFDTIPGGA